MFKIGQKVVCIHVFKGVEQGVVFPIHGEIYTIRDIFAGIGNNSQYLTFKEIVNPKFFYGDIGYNEARFNICWFRPIQESESFAEEVLKNIAEQIEEENLVAV